jgi:hypothetical protein
LIVLECALGYYPFADPTAPITKSSVVGNLSIFALVCNKDEAIASSSDTPNHIIALARSFRTTHIDMMPCATDGEDKHWRSSRRNGAA